MGRIRGIGHGPPNDDQASFGSVNPTDRAMAGNPHPSDVAASRHSREESLLKAIISGVLIAIIPAIFGYVFGFFDSVRKDNLYVVNQQIEKLYGPLYNLTKSGDATWQYFRAANKLTSDDFIFGPDYPHLTVRQVEQWRIWMKTVFQPINLQLEKIIVENSQLVIGSEMPPIFQDLIAHTEGYKTVMATWTDEDKRDVDTFTSSARNAVYGLNFPYLLSACAKDSYVLLKQRQELLQKSILSGAFEQKLAPPNSCNVPIGR